MILFCASHALNIFYERHLPLLTRQTDVVDLVDYHETHIMGCNCDVHHQLYVLKH